MKHFFKRHYLGLLVVASFLLALVGFLQYYHELDMVINILDIIYAIFHIFLFQCDFEPEHINIFLNIARFLAPVSLAGAIVQNIIKLFSNTFNKEKAKHFRDHLIFCGDHQNLKPLQDEQTCMKRPSLLVRFKDEDASVAGKYKMELSVKELSGSVLKRISFYRSRYLVISNEDDLQSIEIASKIVHSLDYSLVSQNVEIVLVFNNPEWAEIASDLDMLEELNRQVIENPFLSIRYINFIDRGIRKLLKQCSPDIFKPVKAPGDNMPEVLISGFNVVSQRMLISLALNAHYLNPTKLKVYLSCETRSEVDTFVRKFQLDKMLEIIPLERKEVEYFDKKVDLLLLSDEDSLVLFRNIVRVQRNELLSSSYKVVCIDKMISDLHFGNNIDYVFEIAREVESLEALVDESIDEMAMSIHANYIREQRRMDHLSEAIDTHTEWEKLTNEIKDRNRYPADHIEVKARAMNCSIVSEDVPAPSFSIKDFKYLEEISECEHRRWCAYMYYKGWTYGEKRDNKLKKHPDLLPYEELSEEAKKKDRDNIVQIPELLALVKLKLVENKN